MDIIIYELVNKLKLLKRVKIPTGSSSDEQKVIFDQNLSSHSAWLKDTITKTSTGYVGSLGVYYFLCYSKTQTIKPRSEEAYNVLGLIVKDFLKDIKLNNSLKIIMWLQKEVISLDITPFMYKLLKDGTDVSLDDFKSLLSHLEFIGDTREARAIVRTDIPTQIFISEKKDGTIASKSEQTSILQSAAKFVMMGAPIYIHSTFRYNACAQKPEQTLVTTELENAVKIGAKGVVMHVGKNVNGSMAQIKAIMTMYANIKILLRFATVDTPLILETPAGQGDEVLTTVEEMISFYKMFSEYEQSKFKLCVDTAHVWASGYHPLTYLKAITSSLGPVVKLVHYNDAKYGCYCLLDRHFAVGGGLDNIKKIIESRTPNIQFIGELGYIGVKRMLSVAEWCSLYQIDAVTEN